MSEPANGTQTVNVTPVMPRIEIELDPRTGHVQMRSSVGDAVIFMGMIEMAKNIFMNVQAHKEEKKILVAPPGLRVS